MDIFQPQSFNHTAGQTERDHKNEVIYKLTATVDDEVVFEMDYPDTTMLQEDGLRKAETMVERQIEQENTLWDEIQAEVENE